MFTLALTPASPPGEGETLSSFREPDSSTIQSSAGNSLSSRRPSSRRFHEAEIGSGEAPDVGEDGGEVAVVHAEPGGNGGEVLVDGGGGNPAAGAGVVGAVDGQRGEFAVGLTAQDRTRGEILVAGTAQD